jgi:hypothetical protein
MVLIDHDAHTALHLTIVDPIFSVDGIGIRKILQRYGNHSTVTVTSRAARKREQSALTTGRNLLEHLSGVQLCAIG